MNKKGIFEATNFGMILVYSLIILLVVSFIANQVGFPFIPKVGYSLLIVGVCVAVAMVISMGKDFRIETKEIVIFILAMAVLFGSFFILKYYIPGLFSAFPETLQSGLNSIFAK